MLIQTNFIAGKMNKSVDERLVPVGEYVDALNVRLGSTESTEIGAVENSKGNTALTTIQLLNQPGSMANARCIGAYEDGINETIYWFVHNENCPFSPTGKADMILSFNTNSNSLTYHVVSQDDGTSNNTTLNFSGTHLITGVNKINDLLFFTDDLNPPRYINVTRNYALPSPVDGFVEEDISVIVKPPGFETTAPLDPLPAPFLELIKDTTEFSNYIEERFLCFAYRYRYEDGGYSATSLFTNPAFEPRDFAFSFETFKNEGMLNKFNKVKLYFNTGSKRVKEVQLLYKEAESNTIFIIKKLNKADLGISDDVVDTITFINSEILTVIGSDELLRLYDNVPKLAKAQTIQGNRLMYGNYVDQYDVTLTEGGTTVQMDYSVEPEINNFGGETLPGPAGSSQIYNVDPTSATTVIDSRVTFDLSSVPTPIAAGTVFSFSLPMQNVQTIHNGGPAIVNTAIPDFVINFTFGTPTTYGTVNDMLTSAEFSAAVGNAGNVQDLLPYTNPVQPIWSPLANQGNPAQSDFTLTGTFNNSIPFYRDINAAGGATPVLVNTAITNSCGPVPGPPQGYNPNVNDPNFGCIGQNEPFGLNVVGNSFTLTALAAQYYFDDSLLLPAPNTGVPTLGPPATVVSNQYDYFAFNIAGCNGGYTQFESQGSLHSHRDYEVGVVYMDSFGRSSTVLTSITDSCFIPAYASTKKNTIKVTLNNLAPFWAEKYKFVIKPSKGDYNNIWSALVFEQLGTGDGPTPFKSDPTNYWFKLDGDSQNLVAAGDTLIVKRDAEGAVPGYATAEVLDKEAVYSGQINTSNPPGTYIKLKASGWSAFKQGAPSNIDQTVTRVNGSEGNCNNPNATPSIQVTTPNQNLPAGSAIKIRAKTERGGGGGNCNDNLLEWNSGFITVPQDYETLHQALLGLNFGNMVNINTASQVDDYGGILFDPALYGPGGNGQNSPPSNCFVGQLYVHDDGAAPATFTGGNQTLRWQSGNPRCDEMILTWLNSNWQEDATNILEVKVNFSSGVFCFETEPQVADPNLFFDASDFMDIETHPVSGFNFHQAKQIFQPTGGGGAGAYVLAPGSQNQSLNATGTQQVTSLETVLDFRNCYVFGNGVESMRIEDRIDGKSFNLGNRVLAPSNQDFVEADRYASMTYSGVFIDSANSNNLNEFNLGLVNYKDLESTFGPIMKMHSRETDILVLQEDRISYVLAGKNVVTDSTGGGAIASVPEVLGTQIARIEEYGISFNPESFAQWGHQTYFTDTKRGAVIQLRGGTRGESITVVSQQGMRSFFRDQFNAQLTTQKLGGYDPYMNEYVLSTNNIGVDVPVIAVPCGQVISQQGASVGSTYNVNVGTGIGTVNIPYIVTAGQVSINIEWNGAVVASTTTSTSGSLSFTKTSNSPNIVTVTVTPVSVSSATYNINVECPVEPPLNIIRVVVSSPTYAGSTLHIEHDWQDPFTVSPFQQTSIVLNASNPTSFYDNTAGFQGSGVFPYNGSSVRLKTKKLPGDTFDFDPATNNFKILSSNTLYQNNTADINTLLGLATNVIPVNSPNATTFEATELGTLSGGTFTIPPANQFLYLVWDLRNISNQLLCYSATSAADACCNCDTPCGKADFSPVQQNIGQVCLTNNDAFGSKSMVFNNSGAIPVVGDIVFDNTSNVCDPTLGYPSAGYYIVDQTIPAPNPKNWIEIGANGLVINSGTC